MSLLSRDLKKNTLQVHSQSREEKEGGGEREERNSRGREREDSRERKKELRKGQCASRKMAGEPCYPKHIIC